MTRPKKKRFIPLNIAYSIDYRGLNDDVLTFVFVGAFEPVLRRAFDLLAHGGYVMDGYEICDDHACWWPNGQPYFRLAVTPKNPHFDFMNLSTQQYLMESRIRDQGHEITFYPSYQEFINLSGLKR